MNRYMRPWDASDPRVADALWELDDLAVLYRERGLAPPVLRSRSAARGSARNAVVPNRVETEWIEANAGAFGLTEKQLKSFGSKERGVLRDMDDWVDGEVADNKAAIEKERKRYAKRKWKFDASTLPETKLIDRLDKAKTAVGNELVAGLAHKSDLITLANVVKNEAGTSNLDAKKAVAYAFMNRFGSVQHPSASVISGYQKLHDLWPSLGDNGKLAFLEAFPDCLKAARARLDDSSPSTNDPTHGATHWVSPKGLKKYDASKHGSSRYKRTVGTAVDRAFPLWARDPQDAEVARMQSNSQLGPNFDEIVVSGVPKEDFLFYVDVP